ncbi:MAG: DUF3137 domain-containing protein [Lachnospiraceae bacterium]|nr:DUF3137 domain-containing protein [Lachnospiraceae bacterium]
MNDSKIIKTIHRYQVGKKFFGVLAVLVPGGMLVYIMLVGSLPELQVTFSGIHFIIGAVVGIAIFIIGAKYVDKLQKKLKLFIGEYVTKGIIAEQIDIKEYDPNGCYKDKFLRQSGILPGFDKKRGSDYIKGFYKGQEVTYCDIELEVEYETTDSDGHSSHETSTVFKGPVISLPLGKTLGDKRVRIMERRTKRRKKGFISDLFKTAADSLGIKMKEQSISLESEAFNNQFEVKTNDEELAFYILTPQFMENIVDADRLADGRTNICFGGDYVIIAIYNNRDAFELEKTLRNKKQLEKTREQMRGELREVLLIVDEILKKDKLF